MKIFEFVLIVGLVPFVLLWRLYGRLQLVRHALVVVVLAMVWTVVYAAGLYWLKLQLGAGG